MVLTATGYVPIEANADGNGNSPAKEVRADIGAQSRLVVKTYNADGNVTFDNPTAGAVESKGTPS
jgi:hypothetical protein